ncbi:MAG: hypothetical protein JO092_04895 [Candidatus Eremiobacteraeota bacterium]|nr:hypothetical protein [Candidatus Eremiobacteraeota bacterium]
MKRFIAPVVCATILGGCGLTSSPAEGLAFRPPAGWQGSPGIMGFMQFWKPPTNSDEVLMLFRSPKQIDPNQVLASARLRNTRIERRQEIKVCGNQPAIFFEGAGTSSSGNNASTQAVMQMVMTNANGATYFAMYAYPVGTRPNSEALAALRELCPKH